MSQSYLACDLGAESGRLMAGTIENGVLSLEEIHRFQNVPIREEESLRWDIAGLLIELKEGLRKAAATGRSFASISTDSWGVDYVLFRRADNPASSGSESEPLGFEILEPVYHYRDARSKHGVERAFNQVEWAEMFRQTGIQFMPINTLFQLAAENPERLEAAEFLLGVGDAFNYFLSGVPVIEVSMASTFQLYDPRQRRWADPLIRSLGFPRSLFPEIVPSGYILGSVRADLASDLGLAEIPVIASCSHDTGAAVAGVPSSNPNSAYLSSGTWSLMGVELAEPIITDRARDLNFTNEIGFGQSVRLLKNISGLWLLQECRRQWAREGFDYDYSTLATLASRADRFFSLINPAADEFLAPANMVSQIVQYCRRTNQPAPQSEGAVVRCILESLALLYRRTLLQIQELIGRGIEFLHIVGGGSNNALLNQFTANALEIPVLAGPAEATAAGNILIQAIALGHLPNLEAARQVVRDSHTLRRFEPENHDQWRNAYARFEKLVS